MFGFKIRTSGDHASAGPLVCHLDIQQFWGSIKFPSTDNLVCLCSVPQFILHNIDTRTGTVTNMVRSWLQIKQYMSRFSSNLTVLWSFHTNNNKKWFIQILYENEVLFYTSSELDSYHYISGSVEEWWRRWPCIPRVGGSSPTAGDFSLQQWYCCPSKSLKQCFGL